MSNPVVNWAKSNPVAAGAAAVGIIVVVMLVTGGGSSGSEGDGVSNAGSAGVQAYYAAVAQQGQAGAQIQIAQIQANAETNKALIASTYGIENAKIWAPVSLAGVQANATNEAAQIASNERMQANAINLANEQIAAQTALGNAALTVQQNVAFKQINAQKKSLFDKILGAATTIVPAIATGGTSLGVQSLGKIVGGSAPVKLPALGSPGQWT